MGCICNGTENEQNPNRNGEGGHNQHNFGEKGLNEKHNHMLVFSSQKMRNNNPDFTCDICSKLIKKVGKSLMWQKTKNHMKEKN